MTFGSGWELFLFLLFFSPRRNQTARFLSSFTTASIKRLWSITFFPPHPQRCPAHTHTHTHSRASARSVLSLFKSFQTPSKNTRPSFPRSVEDAEDAEDGAPDQESVGDNLRAVLPGPRFSRGIGLLLKCCRGLNFLSAGSGRPSLHANYMNILK